MATKEELTAVRKWYRLARTFRGLFAANNEVDAVRQSNQNLVWKLAHTRVRCRASQSDASRTSLGTRLWPASCHLSVTSARHDSNS